MTPWAEPLPRPDSVGWALASPRLRGLGPRLAQTPWAEPSPRPGSAPRVGRAFASPRDPPGLRPARDHGTPRRASAGTTTRHQTPEAPPEVTVGAFSATLKFHFARCPRSAGRAAGRPGDLGGRGSGGEWGRWEGCRAVRTRRLVGGLGPAGVPVLRKPPAASLSVRPRRCRSGRAAVDPAAPPSIRRTVGGSGVAGLPSWGGRPCAGRRGEAGRAGVVVGRPAVCGSSWGGRPCAGCRAVGVGVRGWPGADGPGASGAGAGYAGALVPGRPPAGGRRGARAPVCVGRLLQHRHVYVVRVVAGPVVVVPLRRREPDHAVPDDVEDA
ncbi:hypothetical protein CLV70_106237 [Pseudosporangium ferrugineum]|uniref:Uncharacterized protein n=1 Tax=Pseudosporangium ferrugineum TaxID=439699 RepID=A0A2T0S7X1_9ACTN|nr:hypothetical protein CLV70_106237 [Pseudosporangium ferrugineum]